VRRFVVIPAFNEESTIRPLVESLLPLVESVIVVDDCSNDQTCAEALAGGALVSRHSSNSGYDAALDTGIMLALGRGATSILTLDADGQHPLGYVNRMFDFVEQGHADVAIGTRLFLPRISERIFSFVTMLVYGVRDITSGMKCYSASFIGEIDYPSSYQSIGTYLAIKALKSRKRVCVMPIPIKNRQGLSRFGSSLRSEIIILRAFWRSLWLS